MKNVPATFCGGPPFGGVLDRICHMNLMRANLCRWPLLLWRNGLPNKAYHPTYLPLGWPNRGCVFWANSLCQICQCSRRRFRFGSERGGGADASYIGLKRRAIWAVPWRWDHFSAGFMPWGGNVSCCPQLVCSVFFTDKVQKYSCTLMDNCWLISPWLTRANKRRSEN